MRVRGGTCAADQKSEDFCKRMLRLCLICHVRRSLCCQFEFFEQFSIVRRFWCDDFAFLGLVLDGMPAVLRREFECDPHDLPVMERSEMIPTSLGREVAFFRLLATGETEAVAWRAAGRRKASGLPGAAEARLTLEAS
jgi:hypothetical protein